MKKPKEPSKKEVIHNIRQFYDWNYCWEREVPLDQFILWCKENVPTDAANVKMHLIEGFLYDEGDASLEVSWDQEVDNEDYEKQMVKYNKKLEKYEKARKMLPLQK